MYSQSRKFVINERSVPKQTLNSRVTYQTSSKYATPTTDNPYQVHSPTNYVYPSTLHRVPSQGNISNKEENRSRPPFINRQKIEGENSNLKMELQNLKMEVNKLMSKETDKFMIPKTPYKAKQEEERHETYDMDDDFSDTASITSEALITEPLRQLEKKASTQNYDHGKYMELENSYLKTELRNLKNKYNDKKREMTERCDALEKKNEYLEVNLHRSEEELTDCKKTLATEITNIKKQLSRNPESSNPQKLIVQPKEEIQGNELIRQKMKRLYQEIAEKTAAINQFNISHNEIEGELTKKAFELQKQRQVNKQLSKQIEFTKREMSRKHQHLQNELSKGKELQDTIEKLRQKNNELANQLYMKDRLVSGSEEYENKMNTELEQYERNEASLLSELKQITLENKRLKELNATDQQQIIFLKRSSEEHMTKIQQLSKKLKLESDKLIEREESFRKDLQRSQRQSEDRIILIRQEYEHLSFQSQEQESKKNIEKECEVNSVAKDYTRQLSKWKAEYKILKMKYEERVKVDQNKKSELDEYYRGYVDYKQKAELYDQRNKLLSKTVEKYLEKLREMEEKCLRVEVDLNKCNSLHTKQLQNLQEKNIMQQHQRKDLEEKYEDLMVRFDKEGEYRKTMQREILLVQQGSEQYGEVIEKIKKRSEQQDEKLSKNVKEIKNKEGLITKLRKEIRELIENHEKKFLEETNREKTNITEDFLKRQSEAVLSSRQNLEKEMQIFQENCQEIQNQNLKMKKDLTDFQKEVDHLRQQNHNISHLYNLKITEQEEYKQAVFKEKEIQQTNYQFLNSQLNQLENNYQNQLKEKNMEIQHLRIDLKKKINSDEGRQPVSFDETLKRNMEELKRVKDQLLVKVEEVFRLRDSLSAIRSQFDNQKSQIEVNKLKTISEKKNIQVSYQVQIQNLKNKLSVESKKVNSLEQKVSIIIEENKKKDSFIQNYIMGKKLPTADKEFVSAFIRKYELTMSGTNINEKMKLDSQELEKLATYNYNLMKEIAELKEKLLMYEAISSDKLSLYDSKCSESSERNEIERGSAQSSKMKKTASFAYEDVKTFK